MPTFSVWRENPSVEREQELVTHKMEGSQSEAVFDALNLNPQLFINEALNTADDLVDDAFTFFLQQASTSSKTEGTDRSQDLTQGVTRIRLVVQSVLDKRLAMWEKYCLNHCFSVPQGFSFPTNDDNSHDVDGSICQDALYDLDLDAKLDSLRNKLSVVGKESAMLNRQLQALERQSVSTKSYIGPVYEASHIYDQNSMHEMFQEMMRIAPQLRQKIGKLKMRRMEETNHSKMEMVYNSNGDLSRMNHGFSSAKIEDIHQLSADVKNC